MTRAPRVLVAGAFGQGNPGDESVLDAFVSALRGCQVSATVATPPSLRGPDGGLAYRAVPSGDRRAVAGAVLGSDLTVATATVFKTLHPSTHRRPLGLLANTLALAVASRTAGRPLEMAAVGAGDLSHPLAPPLVRAIVGVAGAVDVRDEESAGLLRAAGVGRALPVTSDVVWSVLPVGAPPPPAPPPPAPGRRVVMAISHLAGGASLIGALQGAATLLYRSGFEVILHPWQPERDRPVADAIAAGAAVPVQIWDPPADVPAASAAYAGADVVLGLRFHSLVAAAAAGTRFVAVAHEAKLAGLARRLGQVAVTPADRAPEMQAAVTAALAGPPPAAGAVQAERDRAVATLERVRASAFANAGTARRSVRARLIPALVTSATERA